MRGIRVYIPVELRKRVLDELHTAHFGMTKMKALARGYCWWNNMDKEIEEMVINCNLCQSHRAEPSKLHPVHCWEMPTKPFQRVHGDFAGPLHGVYLFVFVDAYTKWPEIHILKNITAETTIESCRDIFSTFGIPSVFVSDWGTQFTSYEFKQFLNLNGIQHKQGAPYHPSTNGQAEIYVKMIKDKLKTIKCKKSDLRKEIANILLSYRRSVHPATGRSPAMMMFGRQIRSRLDVMMPVEKQINKSHECNQPKPKFDIADRVAVRDYLTKNKWQFGRIIEKVGALHFQVQLDDGRVWKRHMEQIRKVGDNLQPLVDIQHELDDLTNTQDTADLSNAPIQTSMPRNSVQIDEPENSTNELPNASMPSPSSQSNIVHESSGNLPLNENIQTNFSPQLRRSNRQRKAPERLNYGHAK